MEFPPNFQVGVQRDQLTVVVTGPLTADGAIAVVRARYPGFFGRRILWDLTVAEVSGVGRDDFVRIATAVRESTPVGIERRTAYVVADGTAYLHVWKYVSEVVRARVPVEYQAFTSAPAAQAWLESR